MRVRRERRLGTGGHPLDCRDDELGLGAVPPVEGRPAHARFSRHGRDRHLLIADVVEQPQGGVEDGLVNLGIAWPAGVARGLRRGHAAGPSSVASSRCALAEAVAFAAGETRPASSTSTPKPRSMPGPRLATWSATTSS